MRENGTEVNGVDGAACTTKTEPFMRASGMMTSATVKE